MTILLLVNFLTIGHLGIFLDAYFYINCIDFAAKWTYNKSTIKPTIMEGGGRYHGHEYQRLA